MTSFSLDRRSLRIFRVLLGLTLFRYGFKEFQLLHQLYGPDGVLPAGLICSRAITETRFFSMFCWDGSELFQGGVFVLQMLSGLLLAFGWQAQVFAALSAYFVAALQFRLRYLGNGGEPYLLWVTIWAAFLPFDRKKNDPPHVIKTWPTVLFTSQVVLIYTFGGINKFGASWVAGRAVFEAVHFDLMIKPFAKILWDFPNFDAFMTYFVRIFEILAPLPLLLPKQTTRLRFALVATFFSFHIGLWFFFYADPLPLVGIVTWTAFIPSGFWDRGWKALVSPEPASDVKMVWGRRRVQIASAIAIYLCITMSCMFLPGFPFNTRLFRAPIELAGLIDLRQDWDFFAPDLPDDTGWFTMTGLTSSGHIVELDWLHNQIFEPVRMEKPENVVGQIDFARRWQKLYQFVRYHKKPGLIEKVFGASICHQFPEQGLRRVSAVYHRQRITVGKPLEETTLVVKFIYDCAAQDLVGL